MKKQEIKLWVDDIRPAPEGWLQARNVTDAIKTIARFREDITDISLDHDISMAVMVDGTQRPFPSRETFQAVAYYILEVYKYSDVRPKITIHTANPVGGVELMEILRVFFNITIAPESRVNRLESEV